MNQGLTTDDLLWIIGQKETQLLVIRKQMEALTAENAALTARITEQSDATKKNG